jgi:hypothetical protein
MPLRAEARQPAARQELVGATLETMANWLYNNRLYNNRLYNNRPISHRQKGSAPTQCLPH